MSISNYSVVVQNVEESSLVVEVKENKDNDPILVELKNVLHNQKVEVFSQRGDGVHPKNGRLSVPDVGE